MKTQIKNKLASPKKNISQKDSSSTYSSNIISTPCEKVLSILNEAKNFILSHSKGQNTLISSLDWAIEVITSRSLYSYEFKEKEKVKKLSEENPTEQKEEEKEINKKEEKEINQKEKSENENIENKKEIFINKEEKEKLLLDKSNNKSIELSEKEQNNSHEKRKSTNKRKSIPKDQNQIPINVKELISRMNLLEIKLNNIYINKDYKNIKQELKNHDLENQSDFKVIDMKLNDFNKILDEYKKKIEDCELKCASFDILNIIKDNGNGNIDGAKIFFRIVDFLFVLLF